MTEEKNLFEYALRLGDNCLILAQRMSQWCGHAPVIEEDIALSNTALDLLGQARLWLSYAGKLEGIGRDEDQLAYHRNAYEFRNLLLVEQPNGSYAETLVRQFFFDTWHYFALTELKSSLNPTIAGIAEKACKEVTYHLTRSRNWIVRLGDGTQESRNRIQEAIENLWEFIGEMFEMDEIDYLMFLNGIGCDLVAQHASWQAYVMKVFEEATLTLPSRIWAQSGGKRGVHTEYLGHILTEMQFLQRVSPGAQW